MQYNVARCRFFAVPCDGPMLLGMPDIELLGILKITCDVVEDQQVGRKFDLEITEATHALNCKTHTVDDCRSDSTGITSNNANMSDYFRSSQTEEQTKKPGD